MFDFIVRSVLVEFLGAFTKWSYYAISYKIKGKKIKGFIEIWEGRKGSSNSEIIMYGISNIILGYLIIIALIGIIFLLDAL